MTCASAQSDQSLPLCSMGSLGPKLSSCGQRRLWSDWADAQADLSLCWAHMLLCWFCHEAAQMFVSPKVLYVYYCSGLTNSTNLHIPFSYTFKMTYFKEVGGAEAQTCYGNIPHHFHWVLQETFAALVISRCATQQKGPYKGGKILVFWFSKCMKIILVLFYSEIMVFDHI